MTNLAQHLVDTAAAHGDRPALRMDDAVLTYDRFRDDAARVAAGLRARGVSSSTARSWPAPPSSR